MYKSYRLLTALLSAVEFEAQASALKSHYEGRLGQLQRELDSRPPQSDTSVENTAEIDKLRKENAEIVQKVWHCERLFCCCSISVTYMHHIDLT